MNEANTIGERMAQLRKERGLTLRQEAVLIGCDAGYLSKLENGKVTTPSERFLASVSLGLRVDRRWLSTGEGLPFAAVEDTRTQEALPGWTETRLSAVQKVLPDLADALSATRVLSYLLRGLSVEELQNEWAAVRKLKPLPYTARLFWNEVFMLLQVDRSEMQEAPAAPIPKDFSKNPLTSEATLHTMSPVQPILPTLLERLRKATKERGRKTELAGWLGVPRQSVNDWLSERVSPSGETTLRLLHWVEQEERQPKPKAAPVPAAG